MAILLIRLDPRRLANPDADLRYALAERLVARAGDALTEDGYDYVGAPPFLVLYFTTRDLARASAAALSTIRTETVLENALADAALIAISPDDGPHALEQIETLRVLHPANFNGARGASGP